MIGQYSFGGRGGVDAHDELSGETLVEGKQRVGRAGRIDVRADVPTLLSSLELDGEVVPEPGGPGDEVLVEVAP